MYPVNLTLKRILIVIIIILSALFIFNHTSAVVTAISNVVTAIINKIQFLVGQALSTETQTDTKTVIIGNAEIIAEVAQSDEKRALGLSGRQSLEKGKGVLFVFPNDRMYGIWMKDMKFPIDIIWLDSAKQIIHIEKNVQPESYPETFRPGSPARYVLEIPAGTSEESGITIGAAAVWE